jgi:hypothetical protein
MEKGVSWIIWIRRRWKGGWSSNETEVEETEDIVISFLRYLYFSLVGPGQMKAQLFNLDIWKHTYKMTI